MSNSAIDAAEIEAQKIENNFEPERNWEPRGGDPIDPDAGTALSRFRKRFGFSRGSIKASVQPLVTAADAKRNEADELERDAEWAMLLANQFESQKSAVTAAHTRRDELLAQVRYAARTEWTAEQLAEEFVRAMLDGSGVSANGRGVEWASIELVRRMLPELEKAIEKATATAAQEALESFIKENRADLKRLNLL